MVETRQHCRVGGAEILITGVLTDIFRKVEYMEIQPLYAARSGLLIFSPVEFRTLAYV
jgi:hypothetical protein